MKPGRNGAHAQGMDKLQRAGRDFLMRLVAKHGLRGGAGAGSGDLPPFYMIIDPDNPHPPETAH